MAWRKRWFVLALATGAALAFRRYGHLDLNRLLETFHRSSSPSAGFYDLVFTPFLDAFFARVAREVSELAPRGQVLEVGSGPGRLATKTALAAPEIRITAVDILPGMVERANALAARAGVADRVRFTVGDVAALSFPEASFDLVVSTLSLHHWQNPERGLAELHRVLRPGGLALIYDVSDWVRRLERGGPGSAELVAGSPFGQGGAWKCDIAIRIFRFPLVYRAELKRQA